LELNSLTQRGSSEVSEKIWGSGDAARGRYSADKGRTWKFSLFDLFELQGYWGSERVEKT